MKNITILQKLKIFLYFFSATVILCMAGCTTKSEKGEIETYIKEELGISDFKVSDKYQEIVDEDEYTDKVWTVTVPKTGMEFHVIYDVHWSLISTGSSLNTDYDEAVFSFIQDELPKFQYLHFNSDTDTNGIYNGEITGSFQNARELKKCYNELKTLKSSFTDLGYSDLSVYYKLEYEHPLRNITKYVENSGDSWGRTDDDLSYEKMLNEYIITSLDYRYTVIDSFTDEQIKNALADNRNPVGIYRGDKENREDFEKEKIEYYDAIIASPNGYGISFGSLYEILKQEDFEVTGDYWHYRFIGTNGVTYEISYDFNDYPYGGKDGETYTGYYFLKAGEITLMDAYGYNHFNVYEIEEMTGLRLVDSES